MEKQWLTPKEGADLFGYRNARSFSAYCVGHGVRKKQNPDGPGFLYEAAAVRGEKEKALAGEQPRKSRWKGTLGPAEEKLLTASKDALIQQLLAERSRTRAIVDACMAAIAKQKMPTVIIPKVPNLKGVGEEMHVLISDVQVGQVVDPQTVGGLSRYSFEEFTKRLNVLAEKIYLFHDLFSKTRNITKLVIHWLGDMVEGETIYRGQPFYIDRPVVDQVFTSVTHFEGFLLSMARLFPSVESFMVWGNHGRVGSRADTRHVRDNWDYVLYRILRTALKEQKNLKFFISESPFMVVQHGNFNFFLTHGDQVKSWMNIPFYGLDRMSRKLTGLTGQQIHYLQVGHHHRDATASIPRGRWMVNGSFVGGSLLSVDALQEGDFPKQLMYMFHHQEGIHSMSDLRLAPEAILKPNARGIYTPFFEGPI